MQYVALSLIAVGIFIRTYDLSFVFGGHFVFDEIFVNIIYLSDFLNFEPAYRAGATPIFHAFLLNLWCSVFGISEISFRGFTVVLGLLIGVLFYILAKKIKSEAAALWSLALWSTSLYGMLFSKLSVETLWSILGPLLFLVAIAYNLFNRWPVALILGLSIFTYPGHILYLMSLLICVIAIHFRDLQQWLQKQNRRMFFFNLLLFALVVLLGAQLHSLLSANGTGPLLTGGGHFRFRFNNYQILIQDLFYSGQSWLLLFQDRPLLDWHLIVLTLAFTVRLFWSKKIFHFERKQEFILIASIFVTIILAGFTGDYVGGRRVLSLFIPFVLLSAFLISELTNRRTQLLAAVIVVLGVSSSLLYKHRDLHKVFPSDLSFMAPTIVETIDILQNENLLFDRLDIKTEIDKRYWKSVAVLAQKYDYISHQPKFILTAPRPLNDGEAVVVFSPDSRNRWLNYLYKCFWPSDYITNMSFYVFFANSQPTTHPVPHCP